MIYNDLQICMAQSCVGQVLIPHYGETILENKVAKSDLGKVMGDLTWQINF